MADSPEVPRRENKRKPASLTERKARPVEAFGELILLLAAGLSAVSIALIFIFVGREALPILTSADVHEEVTLLGMFNHIVWQPVSDIPKFSMWPLLIGTIKVTLVAVVIATPIAIGAAIYTAEFASHRVRETVKPAIELLAGFPSVVLGFLALIALATLLQKVTGVQSRLNAFVGGVAVALSIIPIIYTVSEDALTSVPRAFREASLALGATKAQTALLVVVPAAGSGIAGAIILGAGRGIGETMIVLMATGNAALATWNPFDSTRTMAATIGQEMAEVVFGGPHYHVLFFIGVLLFLITFVLNLFSQYFVRRITKSLGGGS